MDNNATLPGFTTRAVHLGQHADSVSREPDAGPGLLERLDHARAPDPARLALERGIAELEGGARGYAFSTGQAAVGTVLELIETGAHVIVSGAPHGAIYQLFESVRRRTAGLRFSYVDPTDPEALKTALRDNTKMVWVESLSAPLLTLADLEIVAAFAKAHELISVCDNTLATPYLLRPLDHGFDIVLHNASGYLNGASDMDGGIAVIAHGRDFLNDKLGFLQTSIGAALAPLESDLTRRALATMALRVERQCNGAARVAAYLDTHPRIEHVNYPGLAGHPHHALAERQMRRFGGVVSAVINGGIEEARGFLGRLGLFAISDAVGGLESVVQHPVLMAYGSVPAEIRAGMGLSDGLFQLSIGIEDADDLIRDLEAALG